uniref:Uncharacterized protein n=1 Tax=Ixodes ricinus TaxID=34613 RepID=A0A6B0U7T9_IXORI
MKRERQLAFHIFHLLPQGSRTEPCEKLVEHSSVFSPIVPFGKNIQSSAPTCCLHVALWGHNSWCKAWYMINIGPSAHFCRVL